MTSSLASAAPPRAFTRAAASASPSPRRGNVARARGPSAGERGCAPPPAAGNADAPRGFPSARAHVKQSAASRALSPPTTRVNAHTPTTATTTTFPRSLRSRGAPARGARCAARDGAGDESRNKEEEEVLIDRDNLDERYFRGFIESEVGEDDNATGRDKLAASMKLAVQATAVLGALTLGFMASNGLL